MMRALHDTHRRWNVISAVILLIGLASAAVVYGTAADDPDDVLGYRIIGGNVYPSVPSKMDRHTRELYGGKALLLADDFVGWFVGLWQGRTLGVTIACLSAVVAGLIFFFNNYVSFEKPS